MHMSPGGHQSDRPLSMLLTTVSGSLANHVQIYRLDKSTAPQPTAFDKKPDSMNGTSDWFVFVALFSFFSIQEMAYRERQMHHFEKGIPL